MNPQISQVDERLLSPVPGEAGPEVTRDGEGDVGLCLSGGGYRAMLFHLGALWRLNEWGYLPRIDRISSVSGGSIVAGILGLNWSRLAFDTDGVGAAFEENLVQPVRRVADRTLDWKAILAGVLLPGSSVGWHLTWLYRRHIFGSATLQNLADENNPDTPRFVINATNLQSGALWRFARPYSWDYRVGKIPAPETPLAKAVAASSAFPPFLSPSRFRFSASAYAETTGEGSQKVPFTTRPVLTDGGVYDNLGLQPVWNNFRMVLISDGGGSMEPHPGNLWKLRFWRWRDWGTQSYRVLSVIDSQVRNLRKRQAIESFNAPEDDKNHREGTYWGIRSHIAHYGLDSSLECPEEKTRVLAQTKTRLKRLEPRYQERLINWGYGICDTAMRKWVDNTLPAPSGFPYPKIGL